MSMVTNVILTFPNDASEDDSWMDKINAYFPRTPTGESLGFVLLNNHNAAYGGTKALEHSVAVGAFNYLELNNLIAHLNSLDWESRKDVRIMICEQENDAFRMIALPDQRQLRK